MNSVRLNKPGKRNQQKKPAGGLALCGLELVDWNW